MVHAAKRCGIGIIRQGRHVHDQHRLAGLYPIDTGAKGFGSKADGDIGPATLDKGSGIGRDRLGLPIFGNGHIGLADLEADIPAVPRGGDRLGRIVPGDRSIHLFKDGAEGNIGPVIPQQGISVGKCDRLVVDFYGDVVCRLGRNAQCTEQQSRAK